MVGKGSEVMEAKHANEKLASAIAPISRSGCRGEKPKRHRLTIVQTLHYSEETRTI